MSRVERTQVVDLRPYIVAAYPRHTAKELAREEGCSLGTAKRIVATGQASRSRRRGLLERVIARLEQHIEKLERLRAEGREATDATSPTLLEPHHRSPHRRMASASPGGSSTRASRAQTA